VLRARRLCTQLPIALTPGSSSPERPGLGNTTGQPWSDATCPCTTCHLNQILVSVKTNLEGFDFLTQFQLRLLICGTRIVVSGKQTPSARKLIFPCEFAKSSLYQNIEETEILFFALFVYLAKSDFFCGRNAFFSRKSLLPSCSLFKSTQKVHRPTIQFPLQSDIRNL